MPGYRNKTSGTIDANGEMVSLEWRDTVNGVTAVQLVGTFTGTVTFEATVDSTNWAVINGMPVASTTPASTATAEGIWYITSNGLSGVRVKATAWTDGSLVATLVGLPNG